MLSLISYKNHITYGLAPRLLQSPDLYWQVHCTEMYWVYETLYLVPGTLSKGLAFPSNLA